VPLFFRELDALFPKSRFVLTTRPKQAWLASVASLFEGKSRWDRSPEGPLYNAFHEACYGVAHFDAAAFGDAFDRHHEAVRSHFRERSGDLLILDVAETRPWERLSGFLERPIPLRPYPHANRLQGNRWIRWRRLARLALAGRRRP
jgi:Sulfotransferase domain